MIDSPNVIAFRPRQNQAALRRPRILIRAARERLLRSGHCPLPGACLSRLRAEEAMLEEARQEKSAEYDVQRHVLLMVAILAEMRAAVQAVPVPDLAAAAINAVAISVRGTVSRAHP